MSTGRTRSRWVLAGALAAIGATAPAQAQRRPPVRGPRPAAAAPAAAAPAAAPAAQATTPTAPADTTLVDARTAYNEGTTQFTAGHFPEALVAFQRAFALRSNPVVLKPIAECNERLGRVPEAIAALERYLAELPAAPDHEQMEARLATLRQRPARINVASSMPGAEIAVDDVVQPEHTPAPVEVTPGHHRIRATLTGFRSAEQEIDAQPGTPALVSLALAPLAPPPVQAVPVAPTHASRRPGPAVWVAASVAGAAAVMGTVFGVMALSSSSDYSLTPTQDLYDTGRRNALLSDVGFSAALLSAGVAVVVYFADRRGAAPAPAHEAAPARAQFTGSGLRLTF